MGRVTGSPRAKCTSGKAAGQKPCGRTMEVRMIQAARLHWGDVSSDVFSKTLPVLLCPHCDVPQKDSPKAPPTTP